MADIDRDLETLISTTKGREIKSSIVSALKKLRDDAKNKANIDHELSVIESGRYGEDVRSAIHDALEKINQNGGSGAGGSALVGVSYLSLASVPYEVGVPHLHYASTLTFDIRAFKAQNDWGAISELNFYDSSMNKLNLPDIGCAINTDLVSYSVPYNQDKIIDGDSSTWWLFARGETNSVTFGFWFEDVRPAYFSITTSNEVTDRDPSSFILGYSDGTTTKPILIQVDADIPNERLTESTVWPCLW